MVRAYRAELLKLRRRGTVVAALLPSALSVLTTVLVFALAKASPTTAPDGPSFVTGLRQLARPDGLTEGFSLAMSLFGLVVLIVSIATMTNEYGLGTLRTNFVAQPDRRAWLAGRLLAMLTVLAASFVAALALGAVTAYVMAPIRGVGTGAWLTLDAAGTAASSYGNALLGAALFGVAGTALAVLVRSTVPALATAIVWTFPLEHIVQNAWPTATQVLPGLAFATVAIGGVPDAAYSHVLATSAGYGLVALVLALVMLRRRDVTA